MPFSHSACVSLQVTGISQKGACAYIWHPSITSCHQGDETLDNLTPVASRAYICGFNSTVTDGKTVLNWLSTQGTAQRQQTEMPSLPMKEAYLHILKAAA